jgi:hypothetical protein
LGPAELKAQRKPNIRFVAENGSGTMSAWQDFHRDWHRWTPAGRLSAVLLGALVAVSLPASILFNL